MDTVQRRIVVPIDILKGTALSGKTPDSVKEETGVTSDILLMLLEGAIF